MGEPRGYALDPDFAEDVKAVVAQVLSGYRVPPGPGPRTPRFQGSNVQLLRVTGAATTVNGARYYPARVQTWNFATGTWGDLTATDAVRLFQVGDFDLTDDGTTAYEGWTVAAGDFSGTTYPIFVTAWRKGLVTNAACVDGDIDQTKTK